MSWLADRKGYDRARILANARQAVARGNHLKAIAYYERVHRIEPENTDLLRRLARQRARAGQREEAWRDSRAVAERLSRGGFVEQAIGVYREYATYVPDEVVVWEALSELELERNRRPDAVDVLLEGRRSFRSRQRRQEACLLLRRARKIDPTHFEANFDLAGLLAAGGNRTTALRILKGLEGRASGRDLRRLRGRLFRLSPGLRTAWRWLAALPRGV
jgi:tetratricopeptide (TPR) repeat protein